MATAERSVRSPAAGSTSGAASPTQAVPSLDSPITALKGVGPKVAEVLARLGIETVGDLLTHYPHRHEDRAKFATVAELRDGETATLCGKVTGVENRPTKNRMVLTRVTIDDGAKPGGVATLTWFNQWRMKQTFERLVGRYIVVYGQVKRGYTSVEFTQPEWEEIEDIPVARSIR